jgi:predicted RNA-binding protein YlxR (DUF448 family)
MTAAMAKTTATLGSAPGDAAAPSLRRCLATGRIAPKTSLIRFVIAPDGAAVPDLAERLPGRGLWISADRAVMDAACRGNKFARAAHRPVAVDPHLPATIERQLITRCCDAIRLARRAGHAVFGFERVRTWIAQQVPGGEADILLLAADSAADAARVGVFGGSSMRIVTSLAGAELGACFAKGRVAYAVVFGGGIAARLATDAGRLAGMRVQPDGMPPPEGAGGPQIGKLD